MPWMITKQADKWLVHKQGADGQPEGGILSTHDTEADAKKQLAVLYASEPPAKAVKMVDGSEDVLEGLGMPWGGPFNNGRDLDGERFTPKTDFVTEWFGKGARPLLFHHGMDEDAGTTVVGRVTDWAVKTDMGVWTQAQLDKQSKYFAAIKDLIAAGKLYFSSGAMQHLVQLDAKSKEIKRWPWVELSLTPTPSNLLATVDLATAKAHLKAINVELPESLGLLKLADGLYAGPDLASKAVLDAAAQQELSASDFAYIDSEGGRHLPMNDAAHARAALARFDQTTFEDDAAKRRAWKRLMTRCKELGIEVGQDMMDAHKSADLKAISGSYESLLEKLNAAINPANPFSAAMPMDRWARVEATFPDHFIACIHQGGEDEMYRVDYMLADDGSVTLGKMTPVEETYKPIAKAAGLIPERLVDHAQLVSTYAAALDQCTKDLSERRIKEGRVLSTATRSSLTECVSTMRAAVESLQGLLDSTDPARAKARADLGPLLADAEMLELELALA